MTQLFKDRVRETTTTTGTGNVTLGGSVTGYTSFSSVCTVADTFAYTIEGINGAGNLTGEWEVGLGTYSGVNTLTRTTVKASSNAGALVNFSAGTKYVSLVLAADQIQGNSTPVATITPSNVGTQGSATALIYGINLIPTSPPGPTGPGWSVILPAAIGSGKVVDVKNVSGFFVIIYPQVGEHISFFSANTAYAIYPTTYLSFKDTGTGQWEMVYNLASIFPIVVGVVAHAGGGQGSATALAYGASVLGTVATDGDSVLMPIALGAGEFVAIANKGAARADVFPVTGGNFQGYPVNESLSIPPGKVGLFLDEGPPNEWAGGVLGNGYAIPFLTVSALSAPANATTYFTGIGIGPLTSEGIQRIRVPRRGRVTRIDLTFLNLGSVGTAELSTISFRKNSTTDTTISAAVNNSAIYQEINTVVNISVAQGDFFEIKWVTPTWVTKPTGVIINGVVFIE